jgi:transcription initiation factor IIE alpha subunit
MPKPLDNVLAVYIVRDIFGEVAEKVCTWILFLGEPTAKEIQSNCEQLEESILRRILYILIKHRCLRFTSDSNLKGKLVTKYSFHFCDIFDFIQYPCQLKNVRAKFGANQCKIFKYILQHGYFDSNQERSIKSVISAASLDRNEIITYLEGLASSQIISLMKISDNQTVWSINSQVLRSVFENETNTIFTIERSAKYLREGDAKQSDEVDRVKSPPLSKQGVLKYVFSPHTSDLAIQKDIELVVRQRFGLLAKRIFRLLFFNRRLDQKEISDMAMLPIKQTREILYKLFKNEYIKMQEVSRTSDHAPSRTFYYWYVDIESIRHKVKQNCLQAFLNILTVLSKEHNSIQRSILSSEKCLYQYFSSHEKLLLQESSFTNRYLENIALLLYLYVKY